jgi:hypothetical protein
MGSIEAVSSKAGRSFCRPKFTLFPPRSLRASSLAPTRLAQLHGELDKLFIYIYHIKYKHDYSLIDGVQARAASSRANSDEM